MQINVTYDASVGSAPAGFTAAIDYVVNLFDAAFTNNVTVNINVGWGEVKGFALDKNALGESIESGAAQYHYADIVSALANEPSAVQQLANASLPVADPAHGRTFDIGSADAKALGLIPGNSTAVDGWVGFDGTASDWSFTPNAIPAANTYDIVGTIEHEFTEIMGRDALVGTQYHYPNSFTVMDLFRYSAPGVRSLAPGASNSTAYFSLDNGVTNSGSWNNHNGNGDLGDWYPAGPGTGGNDAFNDFSDSGVLNVLSPSDLLNMYVMGWNPSKPPPVITSITSTPSSGAVPLFGHVVIDLITNVPVNVHGTPTLKLNDLGTAFYNALTSTSTDLKFDYFAGSSQNTTDLKILSLNFDPGDWIQDVGNGADIYPGLPSGSDLHLVVDTIVPTVSKISVTPSGAVANGGDVKFTLTMSEAVTAAAGAKLTLNDGGVATYTSGTNSNILVFDYFVGAESTTDLKITGLDQTGGQITDLAGNAVSSTLVYDTTLMVNVFRFVDTMNGGGGSWNSGANWSPASVPGINDTALLMAKGTYAARSMQDNSVGILNMAKAATLDIRSNEFDITGGTGTGAIAGNIKVNDGASLSIANTINNTGTITLGSTGDATALIIAGAVVLSGAGHVALTDNLANEIVSDGSAATLTNAGNKIVGAGTIVDANLTLVNEFNGVIDAQGTHSLTIDVAAFTNNGLLESTGDLVISTMTVANSPGGGGEAGRAYRSRRRDHHRRLGGDDQRLVHRYAQRQCQYDQLCRHYQWRRDQGRSRRS